MDKRVAVVTLNWRDYGKKYLAKWVEAVRSQDFDGELKVFITDNETTAETVKFIREIAPEAELVLNNTNDGFAKGMNDGMRAALVQSFDYILVSNIHTVLGKNCISELVAAVESDEKIGVVQARMMMPDKSTINSLGNTTHFLGFGYCLGYKEKFTNYKLQIINSIHYPSGSNMFFSREILEKIGLMDQEYWMYNEDQEIGWRLWLAGYKCVVAAKAVVYNDYIFSRSTKKFYWMDRNRIISILICYKWPTLLLILPAFVIMELGLILFSIKGGWFKNKLRVWKYFLTPGTWSYLYKARKRNKSLRVVSDKKIAEFIVGRIWYQEVDDWKLRFINPVFDLYWKVIKKIIVW